MYYLIGKRVIVYLYTHEGLLLGELQGRVADVAKQVEVSPGMTKDLALVVDIETDGEAPYRNSSGEENEGWFAIQDMRVINDEGPDWFTN